MDLTRQPACPSEGARSMALRLPEILSALFRFCTKSTISSSARVCRAWSEPAFRVLWNDLSSPLPLLRLLGHIEERTPWGPYVIMSPGGLDPSQLHRFQYYAAFTTSLCVFTARSHRGIEPMLINEFLSILHFFNLQLFPRLSNLMFIGAGGEAAPTISIWLRPTLKCLDVELTSPSENVCNFMLKSLSQQTPRLTSLSIWFDRLGFSLFVAVDALAIGIQGLLHLTCFKSDWEVIFWPSLWSQLAVLPALEELESLHVDGMPGTDFPFDANTWSTLLSSQLDSSFQSLEVFTGPMPYWLVAEVFQSSRVPSLKHLNLMVTGMPQSEDIILPVHSDHSHLGSIVLNICDWTPPPSSFDQFRPPSCLEVLAIWTQDVLPISNRQLLNLCGTLPRLKCLELAPYSHYSTRVPHITLKVIPRLVNTCPKLEDLHLFLDTNLSSVHSFDGHTSLSHGLNHLNFGISPVKDALEVAAFLSILFPSSCLTPRINDGDSDHYFGWDFPSDDAVTADRAEEWSEVKRMLNLLQRRMMGALRGRDQRKKSKLRDQADGQQVSAQSSYDAAEDDDDNEEAELDSDRMDGSEV